MNTTTRKSKLWLWIGGIAFALLLAAAFTFTSLRVPIQPRTPTETAVLFALSTFIAVALIIFGFVLFRNLWRAWAERRAMQPGARFKTRALRAAMAISLLPLIILFLVSYTLLNRTLITWFPRPLEQAMESVDKLQEEGRATEVNRLARIARSAASGPVDSSGGVPTGDTDSAVILRALGWGADATWILNPQGQVVDGLRAQRSDDTITPTAHDASGPVARAGGSCVCDDAFGPNRTVETRAKPVRCGAAAIRARHGGGRACGARPISGANRRSPGLQGKLRTTTAGRCERTRRS